VQHVHTGGNLNKKAAWTSMDALGAAIALFAAQDAAAAAASLLEFQRFFAEVSRGAEAGGL
jgi:hypothetical protein